MCGIMINNRKDSCKIRESEYLWEKMKAHWSAVDGRFKDMGNVPFLNLVIGGGGSTNLHFFIIFYCTYVKYTL